MAAPTKIPPVSINKKGDNRFRVLLVLMLVFQGVKYLLTWVLVSWLRVATETSLLTLFLPRYLSFPEIALIYLSLWPVVFYVAVKGCWRLAGEKQAFYMAYFMVLASFFLLMLDVCTALASLISAF